MPQTGSARRTDAATNPMPAGAIAIALVVVLGLLGTDAVRAATLIARYAFDESGPALRNDSVGTNTSALAPVDAGLVYNAPAVPGGAYGTLTVGSAALAATGGRNSGTATWQTAANNEFGALTNDFTVMAWIRPTTVATRQRILGRTFSGSGGWSFGIDGADGRLILTGLGVTDVVSAAPAAAAGSWVHVAAAKSSVTGISFFVNGALLQNVPAETVAWPASTDPWTLLSLGASEVFLGLADDIRVYDGALDAEGLRRALGSPGTLLANYTFGEFLAPTRFDSAGTPSDAVESGTGLVYGGAPIPAATYGSLVLAGNTHGANGGQSALAGEWRIGNNNELGALTNDFTVMAWIRPDGIANRQRVLSSAFGVPFGWGFGTDAGGRFILTGYGVTDVVSTATPITANAWQHVAATKSGAAGVTFYLNGNVVERQVGQTSSWAAATGAYSLLGTAEPFQGLVDEVRVYQGVLDTQSIRDEATGMICRAPNLALPTTPFTLVDDLVLTDIDLIEDLNVLLDVNHGRIGDLVVLLSRVGESGSVGLLTNQPNGTGSCTGRDAVALYDDGSGTAAISQCAAGAPSIRGTLKTAAPLSAFTGRPIQGTWRLSLQDLTAGNGGTLNRWCLQVQKRTVPNRVFRDSYEGETSCPAIGVTGPSPTPIYNTALAPADFNNNGGNGTLTWSATGLPPGLSIAPATGIVSGTPTAVGAYSATITATDSGGCQGSLVRNFDVKPKLGNDAYVATGNVQFVVGGHSTPTTPFTSFPTTLLANDSANVAVTTTAVTNAATAHGTITLDTAGRFTYTPDAGYLGPDSYVYTATANGQSTTATINIAVGDRAWFVNNTYAGASGASDGRSHRPFTTMTQAAAASVDFDVVYVHQGTGQTTGGFAMKPGQALIGSGAELIVGTLSIGAGTAPVLGNSLTLASNVVVRGIDLSTTQPAVTDISGAAANVAVEIGTLTTTNTSALAILSGSSGAISVASLNASGGVTPVTLANFAGSLTVPNLQVSNGSTAAVTLNNVTSATLSGQITHTGSAGVGLRLTSTTLNVGAGGSLLVSNTASATPRDSVQALGGTVTINGNANGLQVTNSTGGAGVSATSGGTLAVTGTVNSIATPSSANQAVPGPTLLVQNTTIGAAGLSFRALSSDGSVNGIVLANTGATGGLSVVGNGGNCSIADASGCSGGYIQNTSGDAVSLTNVGAPTAFTRLRIRNPGGNGIAGSAIKGLNLTSVLVQDAGDAAGEGGIRLTGGLTGSSTWNGLNVAGANAAADQRGVFVDHSTGALVSLAISNSRIQDTNGTGFLLQAGGTATVSALSVGSSVFASNTGSGVAVYAAGSAVASGLVISGNTFTGHFTHLDIRKADTSSLQFKASGNTTMTGAVGPAISATGTGAAGTLQGRIENNVIGGSNAVGNAGSTTSHGIFVEVSGQAVGTVLIGNNSVFQTPSGRGILAQAANGNPAPAGLDLTISGNSVDPGVAAPNQTTALSAILARSLCSTTCNRTRANVTGNVVPTWDPGGDVIADHIALTEAVGSTMELVGNGANATAVLQGTNSGQGTAAAGVSLIAGPINTPPN